VLISTCSLADMRETYSIDSGGGKGAREGGHPGRHFAGAAFEGRKFGILAFALQCVSVSLYF